jgi:hypothetical protein
MLQSFRNIRDLDDKSLGASETLVSRCTWSCNGPGRYSGLNDEDLFLS